MRRSLALCAAAAAALTAFAAPSAAATTAGGQLAPYQMVRSLQLLQDRIADGDHAAMPMQSKLLGMIDQRIRAASTIEFADPRNMAALMIYGMSGGNPTTLDQMLRRLHVADGDRLIATGILHFLTGKPQQAMTRLASVDPLAQPVEIGAPLALLRGSVTSNEDPAAALRLFDQARLLAPGTLIEEAALRRSMPLAIAAKDASRFLAAASDYVRFYLRSPYAAEFAQAFVNGVIALQPEIDMHEVDDVVSGMTAEQRDVIYLRLARKGAIDDLPGLSALAEDKVLVRDEAGSGDPRARLYAGMAAMKAGEPERVAERLAGIDRDRLSGSDATLYDALKSVTDAITERPKPAALEVEPPAPAAEAAPATAPRPEPASSPEPTPAQPSEAATPAPVEPDAGGKVAAARKTLDDIDKLLAESLSE